jgi:hypothetical protein
MPMYVALRQKYVSSVYSVYLVHPLYLLYPLYLL